MLLKSRSLQLRDIESKMKGASSYDDWKKAALEHDEVSGRSDWKQKRESKSYDYANIESRLRELRDLRCEGDNVGLLFALNEGIHGNMGGMGKSALHEKAKFGTKQLIIDYVDELVESLNTSQLCQTATSLERTNSTFLNGPVCALVGPH